MAISPLKMEEGQIVILHAYQTHSTDYPLDCPTCSKQVLRLNKIKVNPDQRARPDYNWRKHITVKKNHETYVGHLVVGFGSGDSKHRSYGRRRYRDALNKIFILTPKSQIELYPEIMYWC